MVQINRLKQLNNFYDKKKEDQNVKLGNIRFKDGDIVLKDDRREMTDTAFTQFVNKLKGKVDVSSMRSSYLQACPEHSRDYQLNTWIVDELSAKDKTENLLFRSYNDTVRAVLSDNYSKIDNSLILDTLSEYKNSFNFEISEITPNELHLRLVDEEFEAGKDETEIKGGWHLKNSEIGTSAARMDFLIYQVICSNGMIATRHRDKLFYQRHYKASPEEVRENLITAMQKDLKEEDELREYMEDIVKSHEIEFDIDQLDIIYDAMQHEFNPITSEVVESAETRANKYLSNHGHKISKYAIISTVTETARDFYKGSDRHELENTADKLLQRDQLETKDGNKINFGEI